MTLEVHVWSDIACPWCYVGKKRFEEAADNMGIEAECIFHSFELDPRPRDTADSRSYVRRLADKYGAPEAQAQHMVDNMVRTGSECGIHFRFDQAVWTNTFEAHRLLHWAKALEGSKQSALKEAFFDAHFSRGKNLNEAADLLSIVAELGLDVDAASAVLASDQYGSDVHDDEAAARELGISGVPFYVVGKYAVGGAQRPETFEKVLTKALEDRAHDEEKDPSFGEGAACGPDGC